MFIIISSIVIHLAGSLVAFDTNSENYTVPVSGKCILTCYVAEVRSFKVSHPIHTDYLCHRLQSDLFARRNCAVCWFNKLFLCMLISNICDGCYHSRIQRRWAN